MRCPQCDADHLAPTKLEPALAGLGCTECGGALLSLVSYRVWRELHAAESQAPADLVEEPEQSERALLCSRCNRIMLKFRYTREARHVLDVCGYCEDVWLQANEWEFLKLHSLQGRLPQIFTDPWQRTLREARTREVLEQEWESRLGPATHARVREIDAWLREHPERAAILDYLLATDPYAT